MRISTCIKVLLLTVLIGIGCSWPQTAQADVADIPRSVTNIFADGNYLLSNALTTNGYKVGLAYNLESLFARNPIVQGTPSSPFLKKNVKQVGDTSKSRSRLGKRIQRLITSGYNHHYSATLTRLNFKNYLTSMADQHSDLGLNQTYLLKFEDSQVNLDKKVAGTIITRRTRKKAEAQAATWALDDMNALTAMSPIALAQHDKTVYVVFLEYSLRPIDVDEDENTGRFGPRSLNYQSKWEKLYVMPIEKLFTATPKG